MMNLLERIRKKYEKRKKTTLEDDTSCKHEDRVTTLSGRFICNTCGFDSLHDKEV